MVVKTTTTSSSSRPAAGAVAGVVDDDEYTDYSCSTSIERLARDVETILRAWHVDRGSDRHVSLKSNRSTTTNNRSNHGGHHHHHHHHGHTNNNNGITTINGSTTTTNGSTTGSTTGSGHYKNNNQNNNGGEEVSSVQSGGTPTLYNSTTGPGGPGTSTSTSHNNSLIRSSPIVWNVPIISPTDGHRTTLTIDLELALWDEPQQPQSHHHPSGSGSGSGVEDDNYYQSSSTSTPTTATGVGHGGGRPPNGSGRMTTSSSRMSYLSKSSSAGTAGGVLDEPLVRSLQRPNTILATNSTGTTTTTGTSTSTLVSPPIHNAGFNNFSQLFGIGQHITLTPILSTTNDTSTSTTTNGKENYSYSYTSLSPDQLLVESLLLSRSMIHRHDEESTSLRYIIGSTLSQQLQTALNCATSNTQCCIPTFGIWGTYQPYENYILEYVNPNTNGQPMMNMESMNPSNGGIMGGTSTSSSNNSVGGASTSSGGRRRHGRRGSNNHGTPTNATTTTTTTTTPNMKRIGSSGTLGSQVGIRTRTPKIKNTTGSFSFLPPGGGGGGGANNNDSDASPTVVAATIGKENSTPTTTTTTTNTPILEVWKKVPPRNHHHHPHRIYDSSSSSIATPTPTTTTTNNNTTSSSSSMASTFVLPNWSHAIVQHNGIPFPSSSSSSSQQQQSQSNHHHRVTTTRKFRQQSKSYRNSKFVPPIISGNVSCPSSIIASTVQATFTATITTYTVGDHEYVTDDDEIEIENYYGRTWKDTDDTDTDDDTSDSEDSDLDTDDYHSDNTAGIETGSHHSGGSSSSKNKNMKMNMKKMKKKKKKKRRNHPHHMIPPPLSSSSSNNTSSQKKKKNDSSNTNSSSSSSSSSQLLTAMTTKYSRLTEWSNILLQHCCPSEKNKTVILYGARHVYGWFKPPQYDIQTFVQSIKHHLLVKTPSQSSLLLGGSSSSGMKWNQDKLNITTTTEHEIALSNMIAWRTTRRSKSSSLLSRRRRKLKKQQQLSLSSNVMANKEEEKKSDLGDPYSQQAQQQQQIQQQQEEVDEEFDIYRHECRDFVLHTLQDAWGSPQRGIFVPLWLWGPLEDPVKAMHGYATWRTGMVSSSMGMGMTANETTSHNDDQQPTSSATATTPQRRTIHPTATGTTTTTTTTTTSSTPIMEPLATFPLRIRSNQDMSTNDWRDIEDSVEHSILDPLCLASPSSSSASSSSTSSSSKNRPPCQFGIAVEFDRDIPVATLAAHQKCLLAALIRAATLPRETMLHHLTDRDLVELWDDDAGTMVALKFAERAGVSNTTKQLVQAMDWNSTMQDMLDVEDAEAIVHAVMNGSLTAGLPNSPESSFSPIDMFSPFRKTAPYGRLLSVLFAHLAQVRVLSSMALIWNVFGQELRRRWESRESLPNMQYVPGLDPHPLELYEQRCYSTIGLKANFAAFLHCSEPDPDDYHCLIGQKLQVFNLGIESLVATEIAEHEAMERFLIAGEVPSTAQKKFQELEDAMKQQEEQLLHQAYSPNASELVPSATTDEWNPLTKKGMKLEQPEELEEDDGYNGDEAVLPTSRRAMLGRAQSKKKWPKSKDLPPDLDESATNYGPPTIHTDLEFWVMDEPGYGARIDQAPIDYAVPAGDDGGAEFDFISPPPTNLDDLEMDMNFISVGLTGKNKDRKKHGTQTKQQMIHAKQELIMQQRAKAKTAVERRNSTSSIATNNSSRKKGGGTQKIVVEGLPDQAWEGTVMGGSAGSVATSCSQSQQYFDAAEAGSIFSMKNGFVNLDTVINVNELQSRPGARCPVHGIFIGGGDTSGGDQLYAPYLQRPYPLTDDIVLERRLMLSRERIASDEKRNKGTLQFRIEVSHRLQKPKLLSDMKAFKAANPRASFEDFTKWYGNPGSPLDDYNEDLLNPQVDEEESNHAVATAVSESAAKKLDKASEAMKILMATRDFWAETWEEATPAPAAEQQPLFNVMSTVEITLDYLERMHPACLINQVLAVNLSAAYFTLISSAEDTIKIGVVEASLLHLRQRIDRALALLSRDATYGSTSLPEGSSSPEMEHRDSASAQGYASDEAIGAAEDACNALSEAETILARAMSLLHKFPKQYDLVQQLLRLPDGSIVSLNNIKGRKAILNAVRGQQKSKSSASASAYRTSGRKGLPVPLLREYILRNLDDSNPCQLSVRFGDKGAYINNTDDKEGGLVLALTKSFRD